MTEQRIDVLDSGYVRLLAHMGDDLTVVRRARHMPNIAWRGDKDVKLINYLMKHNHVSPFQFVEFDFEIKMPIFVARQWMRHWTWDYNEISGRYQELPAEFYTPRAEDIGKQSTNNRQGREPSMSMPTVGLAGYAGVCEHLFEYYHELIDEHGWPRELARCVLPLSTYTVVSGKANLRSLLHFLTLRLDEHAQYEIRVYAEAVLKLIEPIVPVCVAAWRANRQQPERPKDEVVEKIKTLIAKLDSVHVDRLYVSANYTLGDLQRELKEAVGAV